MPTLQGFTQAFPGGTSETYTTPFPISVGTRARDSKGNEFVFCSTAATLYSGDWVTIDDETWAVTRLAVVSARGKVGVVMQGTTAVSDSRGVWIQIYGRVLAQIGGGDGGVVSPSDAANGPTTLVSPSNMTLFSIPASIAGSPRLVTPNNAVSDGMWLQITGVQVATGASAADVSGHAGQGGCQTRESTPAVTAVTSATSFTGSSVYVFLNYPQLQWAVHDQTT